MQNSISTVIIGGREEREAFRYNLSIQSTKTYKDGSRYEPHPTVSVLTYPEYQPLSFHHHYDNDSEWGGLCPMYFHMNCAIVVVKPCIDARWKKTIGNITQFLHYQHESPVVILVNTQYFSEEDIKAYKEASKYHMDLIRDQYKDAKELQILYVNLGKESVNLLEIWREYIME